MDMIEKFPNTPDRPESFFSTATLPWGWRERALTINADRHRDRLDLRAGIMCREDGSLAVPPSTTRAKEVVARETSTGYLPPTGLSDFNDAVTQLILGPATPLMRERSFTIQTIGAANALRLAADCLTKLELAKDIYISEESWGDHRRIFERAGLAVQTYKYFSPQLGGIDRQGLIESLSKTTKGSLVLLQTSCHNPTGYDLSHEDWEQVFAIIKERGLLPFFDLAYPGFGSSLAEDLWPIRKVLEHDIDFLVATSCCKAFSLYDARVGALTAVVSSSEVAERLKSQLKSEVQASYSSPPRYGAAVVAHILQDAALAERWEAELTQLRTELNQRRRLLVEALAELGAPIPLLNIANQRGMFAWSGLDRTACKRLADEFAIDIPSNGRISVGAIPKDRIKDVAHALVEVSKSEAHPSSKLQSVAARILEHSRADLLKSPEQWTQKLSPNSYAERQATSCLYLEKLFPKIISAAPFQCRTRLTELCRELSICHQRQFEELSAAVNVTPLADRNSFYFDSMYQMNEVPSPFATSGLSEKSVLNLLAVHAISYLRGHERYLILRSFESFENNALRPIWSKFSLDAPRNAQLTVECMLCLFGENEVSDALGRAVSNEKQVMKTIWDYQK